MEGLKMKQTILKGMTFRGTFDPTGDKLTYQIIGGVTKADGEFIVKAVNCHAELLEACKAAFVCLFGHVGDAHQEEPLYQKMVEAIAKAEGRS